MHQPEFESGNYNALDLNISLRYADEYLHAQQGSRNFDPEEGVNALLLGSAYLPAISNDRHQIKDIDLYVPDREVFEVLENIPNVSYSKGSGDVLHMEPQSGWHGELYIEFFNSIDGALDRDDGEEVDRVFESEMEAPYDEFFDGDVLSVGLPSPAAFAISKDRTENREKYSSQIRAVDNVFDTNLEDRFF